MGLPPVLTSFTMLVFKPMAAIAITMKNLLMVFKGSKISAETPKFINTVVIIDANKNHKINIGKDFFKLTF